MAFPGSHPCPRDFYAKQAAWGDLYRGDITPAHRRQAALVQAVLGPPPGRVLELGAGGGQHAVALAQRGYTVVAVEQVPQLAQHIRALRRRHPGVRVAVVQGDFYRVPLPGHIFDGVVYWDGFGIGSDADQRALLRRIRRWLKPTGQAVIEVYTPWHAAQIAGRSARVGRAQRVYAFDAEGCRWLDRWCLDATGECIEQSLRCYAPADLRLLLEGTGLTLSALHPRGRLDLARGRYVEPAPLGQAMSYVAVLRPAQ